MPGPPTQHSQGHKNGLKSKLAILDQALVLVKLIRKCASSEVHGWCIGVHWPKAQTLGFCHPPPLAWALPRPHLTASVYPNPPHLPLGDQRCVPASRQREPGCDGGGATMWYVCGVLWATTTTTTCLGLACCFRCSKMMPVFNFVGAAAATLSLATPLMVGQKKIIVRQFWIPSQRCITKMFCPMIPEKYYST